jgi:hypothetical protein
MLYFARHPDTFSAHASQITVFHQKTGPVLGIGYNTLMVLQSPFWQGDANARHNACSEPFVSWFAQPLFLLGLWCLVRGVSKRATREDRSILLLAWLVIGCAPDLFSESLSQPHGLRLMLVQPLLALITSVGFVRAYDWLASQYSRSIAIGAIAVVFLAIAIYNYDALCRRWANDPKMHSAFNYPQRVLAEKLEATPSAKRRYVLSAKWDECAYGIPVLSQSVAYITHTVTLDSQNVKNIHYAFEGEVTASDSVEVYSLPW